MKTNHGEPIMKKILSLVALTAIAFTSLAQANNAAMAQGTQELRLQGGIDFKSAAGTDLAVDLGYGYFISDYLEIGGLFSFGDNDAVSLLGLGAFAEYNLDTMTSFVPFAGGQLSFSQVDIRGAGDETALSLGLYAGVKFFITEDLALAARFLMEQATEDIYLDDRGADDFDYGIDFGLRYFF
jgi:hypothetical protein